MRSRTSGRNEGGATLVEAALVSAVFFFLVFAVFELGLLFRDVLTTSNASREGARAASVQGDNPDTDFFVIRAVEHGLSAMDLRSLDHLVVFKASGPGDTVPAACLTGSQAGLCNHYTPAEFFVERVDNAGNSTGQFGCGALDQAWCPTDRQTSASAGTDYVGIHIQTRHQYVTGFFGGGTTIDSTTILRIEPDSR